MFFQKMESCFQSNLHWGKISSNARKCYRILVQWKSRIISRTYASSVWQVFDWHILESDYNYELKSLTQRRISFNYVFLKSDSHLSKKKIICFNESPLKMMKNALYFILEALFVLKIFKFLPWLFFDVEKAAWVERSS